jgi:hypothetical protein
MLRLTGKWLFPVTLSSVVCLATDLYFTKRVFATAPTINTDYIYAQYPNNNLKNPTGISVTGSLLVFADTGHNQIKVLNLNNPTQAVTVIGTGTQGYADGSSPEFAAPTGVSAKIQDFLVEGGPQGEQHLLALVTQVADTGNSALRAFCIPVYGNPCAAVAAAGTVKTLAGGSVSPGFVAPTGMNAVNNYILDAGKNAVLLTSSSTISNVITNTAPGYTDGSVTVAQFNNPSSIAPYPSGTVISDTGNNVIRVLVGNSVSTLAGNSTPGYAEGTSIDAKFYRPSGIAYNSADGYIYVADTLNHCIRRINSSGSTQTYAGLCTSVGYSDGSLSSSLFNTPTGIAISGGFMYVSDSGNNAIRVIDMAQNVVSTLLK